MPVAVPCPSVSVSDQGLRIRMPGGAQLSVATPAIAPSSLMVSKNLIGQVNAALAPLSPLFNLIDALLAVKDFAEAVPGVLTDPSALAQAISDLITKIDALASLVPQLSVPLMVVDIIDVTIEVLNGFKTTLQAIADQNERILQSELAAAEPGNEALIPIVECAKGVSGQLQESLVAGAAPLNRFIGLLNLFLGLIGVPEIPELGGDLTSDPEAGITVIEAFQEVLTTVRDAIPIP